jgi:hypothetical protein
MSRANALRRAGLAVVVVVVLLTGVARGQEAPPSPTPAPPQEPTLDDLLGLPRTEREPAQGTPELDRRLSDEPAGDDFEQAVDLMDDSAGRLEARHAGLDTQRVQERALAKLDKLIADAQKNPKSGKGKPKPKPDQQPQPSPGQQSSQQQQQAQASASTTGGVPNVPRQDGSLSPPPPSASASWGNLPAHVRDSLTQGASDRFSSLYRALTEEYYKRLAEDRRGGPR